jgi:hypothetical protein
LADRTVKDPSPATQEMKAICGLSVFLLTLGSLLGAAEDAGSPPSGGPVAKSQASERRAAVPFSIEYTFEYPNLVDRRKTSLNFSLRTTLASDAAAQNRRFDVLTLYCLLIRNA